LSASVLSRVELAVARVDGAGLLADAPADADAEVAGLRVERAAADAGDARDRLQVIGQGRVDTRERGVEVEQLRNPVAERCRLAQRLL
jgi:hypothetical protein